MGSKKEDEVDDHFFERPYEDVGVSLVVRRSVLPNRARGMGAVTMLKFKGLVGKGKAKADDLGLSSDGKVLLVPLYGKLLAYRIAAE